MLKIDSFRQKPGYCGPASLKIVMGYLGVKITEKKLALIAGCTPSCGIGAEGLVGAAQKLGFRAQVKDFSDLEDIRKWVNRKKIPVIVDWFAFEGGHYSVVSGIDTENIYLEDPSLGHRRALKLSTFMRLWFDFPSNYLRSKDELIIRRMIIIDRRTHDEPVRKTTGYYAELKKLAAGRRDIRIERHRLKQRSSECDFYRIVSRGAKPNDRFMLIRAGIHGDEVAGPLTIIRDFNRIFDYAHKRGSSSSSIRSAIRQDTTPGSATTPMRARDLTLTTISYATSLKMGNGWMTSAGALKSSAGTCRPTVG